VLNSTWQVVVLPSIAQFSIGRPCFRLSPSVRFYHHGNGLWKFVHNRTISQRNQPSCSPDSNRSQFVAAAIKVVVET
jgi:hypothetical protein